MLVKIYGNTAEGEKLYSLAECIGCESHVIDGAPDPAHASTSYIERQNFTMRMSMRRFTRLTNAFSKKIENRVAMVALHVMYCTTTIAESIRRCGLLRRCKRTSAIMFWSIAELIALILNYAERRPNCG